MFTRKSTRGQAIVLIVFAIIGLIAIVALAIDGGNVFLNRRSAQNAADTSALAGALAKVKNDPNWKTLAFARAASNYFNNDGTSNTVTVNSPPLAGCNGTDLNPLDPTDPTDTAANYIQVIIRTTVNTFFAPVVGINQLHNCVQAIARAKPESRTQLYNGAGIVGLAPDQCKTVDISGNSVFNITGGTVFSNSKEDCGLNFSGNPTVNIINGSVSTVAPLPNNYNVNGNPILNTGVINGGSSPYHYPPPDSMLPRPTCSSAVTRSGTSENPGSYTGTFPPHGVVTLNPGVYCITGDFKLEGSHDKLTGYGVTIVMETGGINWNGSAEVYLTAPTSGDYAGLLFYAPITNHSAMIINGDSTSFLKGTIFFPGADLTFNGTGSIPTADTQMIAYRVSLGGTSSTEIDYHDSSNVDGYIPPVIGIAR